jgi:hypothetical protein
MIWNKKGQGLSFNVIILAILGLIVLVVIVSIFAKQSGKSINALESCTGRGGECKSGCNSNEFVAGNVECADEDDVCCVKIYDEKENG